MTGLIIFVAVSQIVATVALLVIQVCVLVTLRELSKKW